MERRKVLGGYDDLDWVTRLLTYRKAYYEGQPLIDDKDYDALEEHYARLHPHHPLFQKVGFPPPQDKKVSHDRMMLSLGKTYDLQELKKWMGHHSVVASMKIDGNSLALIYREGRLVEARTRGDGLFGEEVTRKIFWIKSIPKQLPGETKDFEIRGEVCCTETDFSALCDAMEALGLEKPSHPRNTVAGILGRKHHDELARFFQFYAFELWPSEPFVHEKFCQKQLQTWGFLTPHCQWFSHWQDVEEYLKRIPLWAQEMGIACDGGVLTYDDLTLQKQLGSTQHHPRYKLAFKWMGEIAQAQILSIKWSTSRSGVVTPVALISPTLLSGATIQAVTLHNAGHVKVYGLGVGDTIEIIRSGEVIPKFLKRLSSGGQGIHIPEKCPSCSSALLEEEPRIYCPSPNCPGKILGQLLHWTQTVGIVGLSEKRLAQLYEAGLVTRIDDFYRLEESDFLRLPGVKKRLAQSWHQSIERSRDLPLHKFLIGLGIGRLGPSHWSKIVDRAPSLEEIRLLSQEDFLRLSGFGETLALEVHRGLKDRSDDMDRLLALGLTPRIKNPSQKREELEAEQEEQEEKWIVLTGKFPLSKTALAQQLEQHGYQLSTTVHKKVLGVITSDPQSNSKKIQTAQKLRIPIWSLKEFEDHKGIKIELPETL